MTQPTMPDGTPQGPWHPTAWPIATNPPVDTGPAELATVFPAQDLNVVVPDLPCGHLPGDLHDGECAYWFGVASGEYAPPPVITLPPHAPGLTPLTDPALREVA